MQHTRILDPILRKLSYWDLLSKKQLLDTQPTRLINAKQAAQHKEIIPDSRMLAREFIDNSLYNPHYGYFSNQAKVLSPKPYNFNTIANNDEFMKLLSNSYSETENEMHQLWHTPTELFQPHYGNAIAKYLIQNHKAERGCENLVIYEIGAGNGTMARNILDYIQKYEPTIYKNTIYNIVEISTRLYQKQVNKMGTHKVVILNKSILEWDLHVKDHCFILAFEVLVSVLKKDNLSHDMVRYDKETLEPLQAMSLIGLDGDFQEVFEPLSDDIILEYLAIRRRTTYKTSVIDSPFQKILHKLNPMPNNLSKSEFLPTNSFKMMKNLDNFFPNHRLLMSDFHSLPDTIDGIDAPVVQTRYRNAMVPCSTYLVQPGLFDIFFPTNFELLQEVYKLVCDRESKVVSHKKFLSDYGNIKACSTISGENPMLDYYENVSFITS